MEGFLNNGKLQFYAQTFMGEFSQAIAAIFGILFSKTAVKKKKNKKFVLRIFATQTSFLSGMSVLDFLLARLVVTK